MKLVFLSPFVEKFHKAMSKKRIAALILILFVFGLCLYFNLPQHIYTIATDQDRKVPIYYVETPEKKVAISFDACWGCEHTPDLLKTLKDYNIKTTFFLTGYWLEKHPDMVEKINQDGHEIGNHTFTHPHLSSLSEEGIKKEIEKTHQLIKEISGQNPNLFRPPFGDYNNKVVKAIKDSGYKPVQWSIDSLDWQHTGKDSIIKRVTDKIHNGAIILFHNNGKYTAQALPEIIEYLKNEGYKIVPISELLYHQDYYIDPHSGAQKKKTP